MEPVKWDWESLTKNKQVSSFAWHSLYKIMFILSVVRDHLSWETTKFIRHFIQVSLYMMTSSNGNIFALLAFCAGNSPVTGEFPSQRPVARSFWCFLWSAPEQTVEWTTETLVIWDGIALIMTSLQCKWQDIFPSDCLKTGSQKITCQNICITLKLDWRFSSNSAEMPFKFYGDWEILNG